jgi:predicted ribosomally synthesized peptide with SipW-like signal peptide
MKKFLISILAVIMATGMIGSSFAYFSDSASSNTNIFHAGTINLKIADGDEFIHQEDVSATWTMNNMEPGASFVGPNSVSIINTGTLAGDHIEIHFSHTINDPGLAPGDMARWLQITSMSYESVSFVGMLTTPGHALVDANSNEFIDLEDVTLLANEAALDNLPEPPPNSGGAYSFMMQLIFNADAPNTIQGVSLTTTVSFTLNQVASQ